MTLSLQYLLEEVRRSERCVYITLSETKGELIDGAASHGRSLDGIDIGDLVADDDDLEADAQVTMCVNKYRGTEDRGGIPRLRDSPRRIGSLSAFRRRGAW